MLDGPICRLPGRFYKHIIADRFQLRLDIKKYEYPGDVIFRRQPVPHLYHRFSHKT